MDNLRYNIGLRMKKARKSLRLTQENMAEKLDISVKHYGDVERGNAGVSLENLIEISNILNLSLDYLIKGAELNNEYIPQALSDIYLSFPENERYTFLKLLDNLKQLTCSVS